MRHPSSLLLLFTLAAAACSSPPSEAPPAGESDLIAGFDAKSPAANAIGTIGFAQDGQYSSFCTATLIGPHTVLTAKHCAIDTTPPAPAEGKAVTSPGRRLFMDEGTLVFAIGPNAAAPSRLVPVINVALSPIDDGGFAALGSDVAVYTLAEEVKDVIPLKVAASAPDASAVGQSVTVVGYGYEEQTGTLLGKRRAGSLTVRAVSGKALQEIFNNSMDAFLAELVKELGQAFVDAHKNDYQRIFDTSLVDQYELFAVTQGSALICTGDSGGPLLQKQADGSRVVVGVMSGVAIADKLPCVMGAAFGTVGPKVQEMISAALSDPCGSLTVAGRCDGNAAVRCTAANEGPKSVVKVNCGDHGQTCGLDAVGNAACVDASPVSGIRK